MNLKLVSLLLLVATTWLCGCGSIRMGRTFRYPIQITDPKATYQTKALFYNLQHPTSNGILFGQQDVTQYGIGWKDEPNRSDVKSVCGSNPAVYGWDVADLVRASLQGNSAGNEALERNRQLVLQAYERGGLNTFCWHMHNFVTGKNFYDTTAAVAAILPGGEQHAAYTRSLDVIAAYFRHLKAKDGTLVPVIFRPLHEHTGSWFWWGKRHCSQQEFVQLWQFTVQYLRDKKKVHNLLYAYSPDRVPTSATYFERYPGDAFVDVLGHDNYWDFNVVSTPNKGVLTLDTLVTEAQARGKVAALTETGLEKITNPTWFSANLLQQLKSSTKASQIAYLMVWRNAHEGHFYAPYPGHSSVPDFLQFYQDSLTTFENDKPQLYSVPKPTREQRRKAAQVANKLPVLREPSTQ
ncbi:glycoside hydrolase family 26 protein [Hymenobacter tibetensis]|uniref:Glycoside hydrolase family 26 protein n=1 Tax=Hymenobacter tibetensis TaxID=497967 RepID=A0ABY4CXG6_9BACT|nr:glycosyl hydrolase [Hymenobacter tibetensis]UOG74702.1 glycoside hydrolase family 26 protein [Hymenobacter tibetensis]